MPKPPPPPEEISQLMRFLVEKTKNVKSPMNINRLASQFKEETGSLVLVNSLKKRIDRHRLKIHKMAEFDMDTKLKMIFALSAPIDKRFLNELKKQAKVGVDRKKRITLFKSNDGSLELEGIHGKSPIHRFMHSYRWQKVCQKANEYESEGEGAEELNGQNGYEKRRVDLVRFLIERTKNVTSPLNLKQLATKYKEEFKCFESEKSIIHQITRFRRRIREMNKFDKPTKIRMLFALSVPIDAKLLKELQNDAIVELDENQRIKKYKANDGSLGLEGDHSRSAKAKAGWAEMKKRRVVNDSSGSDDDGDEEDSSESDESDEEEHKGNVGESTRSNKNPTSSSVRRSDRLQKSRVPHRNKNKKRQLLEKNSDSAYTRNHARMSRLKKRSRISYSSSETSEKEPPEEGDDEESEKSVDDIAMDSENNNIDNGRDAFDPLSYHYYNERDDAEDMDHIPVEAKPENLIEVKIEVPEEPSGSENCLIEPKIEECTREVKQEAEKDDEGPYTTYSLNGTRKLR